MGLLYFTGVALMADFGISESMMVYAALTAATVSATAYESHQAGVATQNADKQKARVAADSEAQKQIDMRQNMLKALASQNASAAVGSGSVSTANTMRQITQSQNDLMVSKANSSAQVSLLDQAGSSAASAGNIGAAGDVLGGATKVAGVMAH